MQCGTCVMRILHVVEATTAGVRRHVYTLASTIDRSQYDVAVACPPMREQDFGDSGFVEELRRRHIVVFPIAMTRAIRPAIDINALRLLVGLIREQHIDLVHAHSSKAGLLGRLAAFIAGVASVYTPNGLYFLGLSDPFKRRMFLTIEKMAGLLGDRVIAVSPGERDLIILSGIAPQHKVVCIENGIIPPVLPADYDRAALRAALGASEHGPLIGTVARIAAQKNPRLFLEAAAALLRNLPDARFVWCGSGDLQQQAENWAQELGISHAIRFLGHREDAAEVMGALDVFWLSSTYEGLPTVLLEAMALDVPIVATDVVGTRDLLRGEAGLLVPQRAESFERATLMLLERQNLRASLVKTASAWVNQRWNAARMVRETEALYEVVLSERRFSPERLAEVVGTTQGPDL